MIMIKIHVPFSKLKEAVQYHWNWIKRKFYIDVDYNSLNTNEKIKWTKAHKELNELYELLHFTGLSDEEKKLQLKKLICVFPKNLENISKSDEFEHLVMNKSSGYYTWKKATKKLEKINKSNPKYNLLNEFVEFGKILYKKEINSDRVLQLLDYESLYDDPNWNAYKLCEKLDISVCPYCNRNYVFVTRNVDGKFLTRPQLDHFFVKSKYPFLSCSFFNLIPSCPFCNTEKNDNDKSTIYPYLEEFGDNAVFQMNSENVEDILKTKYISFDMKYNIEIKQVYSEKEKSEKKVQGEDIDLFVKKIVNSDEVFHLSPLYKEHQLELKDLLLRYINTRGSNLGKYAKVYYEKDLKDIDSFQKEELKKFLLGFPISITEKKFEYPLRKFKEDIVKQLDDKSLNEEI